MRRLSRHLPPSSSSASPLVPIRPVALPAAIRTRPCAPSTAAVATTWSQEIFGPGQCSRGTRSLFCSSPSREAQQQQRQEEATTSDDGSGGSSTGTRQNPSSKCSAASAGLPFKFETGVALFAKRAPRPFPPPFLSPPSGSFSDPLSTHHSSRDRRRRKGGAGGASYVNGELIRGWTNGDDAVYAGETFICANDGVGAWSARPRGHSGLWARLVLHFWAGAVCEDVTRWRSGGGDGGAPDPIASLQRAFERTLEATSPPNDWQGTTTATGAQIFYREGQAQQQQQQQQHKGGNNDGGAPTPLLYVTNLGDSQVMVVRPSTGELVFKTKEQWHWFDCPRQLGTNSPDTPAENAVVDVVEIREGDVVLAMSDGVIDNLWPHEIVDKVCESVKKWECDGAGAGVGASSPPGAGSPALYRRFPGHEGEDLEEELLDGGGDRTGGANGGMQLVADELMEAARTIAVDPFAESPYMEHAIEEGLPTEGGKLDDISVVAALCRRA